MMSVNNDPMWLPVVEEAAKMCYDQLAGSNEGVDCDGPLSFRIFSNNCQQVHFNIFSDSKRTLHHIWVRLQAKLFEMSTMESTPKMRVYHEIRR